jgi:polyisoprenoid-binding protein YceI
MLDFAPFRQPEEGTRMNRLTRIPAALLLAACLPPAALAAAATYEIDPTHTYPRFSYSHFGLSTQLSRFNQTTGTVVWDPASRTASVDIVIDMTSVDTGYATFDEHIQAEDFLDTARHPTATFKSTKVTFEGDRPATIEGELTIKGITRPVTLEVTHFTTMVHPMLNKDAIGAMARTVIRRTEFNAGKYAPNVGDEVTVEIALEAVRQ